ncbi:transcription elongation factor GreA [Occultella aeris]|uniref:transcription elongation factor GreA n=1 Tax=Occultella aeris TaxID=2761496 RepID=UPI0012EA4CCB|nr:transcription elongation factor GreA [Occultella aeris]
MRWGSNVDEGGTVSETTWLTQDSYDRLKAEYDHLVGEGRTEIADKIESAREEGDLKENGGYHAAREEQAKQEARIRQLDELLRGAQVGEAPADDGIVEPGMVVTATVGGEKMTFLLGSREVAGDTDLDVYSASSPLGTAILGHKTGETVEYKTPNGTTVKVKITKAKPFAG